MSTSDFSGNGLPDIAALAQLANQFFTALPSASQGQAGIGLPAGLSHLNAAPPSVPGGVSALGGGLGFSPGGSPSAVSGVPASLTGDLPLSGASPAAFGLPGEAELKALLAAPASSQSQPPATAAGPGSGAAYYFLDFAKPYPAGLKVPGLATDSLHAGSVPAARAPFDINLVRRDFPILQERVNGKQLVWLDNAATTHKPQSVIDRLAYFYAHENSNIHRAAHELAARATDAYEGAREKVRGFLNARSANECVFVRGATEAINLVAQSWGRANIGRDDEIIVSHLEHHANIVPWQMLCAEKGARLRVIPVDDDGQLQLEEYAKLLGPKTRLVAFTQISNALGTVTPARQIIEMAHSAGAKVLLDGAQSVSHLRADVQALDCDWFVFSGHKVFAPTGIGVLYGKEALLNEMPPWQGGGNMIRDVTFESTQYHDAPGRFEAGTGNIADAVGLGAAIDYVNRIGIENIGAYEHQLLLYATHRLKEIPGLRLIGTAPDKAAVLSFVLEGYKTEEVGAALNREGIAVRSGHHCAQPILRRFGLESTVRPSLAFYNNCADVDALIAALARLKGGRSSF
ncbi:family 2A encapsulin nanocompartment cargo protein cysteine desulfurase [Collimonas fungivorans]|uniref:cysteine desulfurase n=1 Tax=Collimonas fungivorans (strain Ter331) TaxID=1005048 RepID=G0ABQ2_COLFT|nr:family 2A encapsulin nanocompartment cargo protein cysteine desulfurase [Collimonas fungivorans]AEK61858.1 Cysteine desulfurase [Collimonas fungivorans Ter331]